MVFRNVAERSARLFSGKIYNNSLCSTRYQLANYKRFSYWLVFSILVVDISALTLNKTIRDFALTEVT